ncbi:ATP-grasp domain-containing protein [Sulfuriferula thiophila]|uniref:ATP-grasp domain-containing protein n=1 Tax=Sulfuriferula thiophila TaxID=1781211 RepID=UPI000F615283|nr:RimK family alpha-L-glutamate ligase [Sulfuriferula thiophila]
MEQNELEQRPLIGLPTLMRMALQGIDLAPLATELIAYANTHPRAANVLLDLSVILQLKQSNELAMQMQTEALKLQLVYQLPFKGEQAALRVLALVGPGDLMSNTPVEFLLEDTDISLQLLYVAPEIPFPSELPEHDLVFVAIGESEQNKPVLEFVASFIDQWPRPVLNSPARILALSRDAACAQLADVPGMVMPRTARIDRQVLEQLANHPLALSTLMADADFPLIVRPVDSHAGRGLIKLESAADIPAYLQAMPEDVFYLSRFVDYSGADGLFRKYRIVLIDGRPYVCHMALSRHWMVHYLNAEMTDKPENRAEEAQFMADFDQEFARKHEAAFQAIAERSGLDYLGVDCAETAAGELLIFEIDSNMIVHAMDPVDMFPYKQPQMRKVFSAFREMLINAANHPG